MRKISDVLMFMLLGLLVALSACSSDVSDELPSAVSRFVTQYFPGLRVKSYQAEPDGGCMVEISGGPVIMFDGGYLWTSVDGRGAVLPQVLMYDELPTELYSYLQGTEQQAEVYELRRDCDYYFLTMHDTVITYTLSDGKITYPPLSAGEYGD